MFSQSEQTQAKLVVARRLMNGQFDAPENPFRVEAPAAMFVAFVDVGRQFRREWLVGRTYEPARQRAEVAHRLSTGRAADADACIGGSH